MSDLATPGADAFLNGTALPTTLYVQGHVGNPGTNGTANVAAETDRVPITGWGAAGSGGAGFRAKASSVLGEVLNAAANETWTHVTYWSASSGGTCWFVDNIADVTIAIAETIQIDVGAAVIALPVWT